MRTSAARLLGIFVLGVPISAAWSADQADRSAYRAGDFVVVTRRSELKQEDKTVDTVEAGVLLGIDQVRGQWLWVTNTKPGWLSDRNVIPAAKAVDYFTLAIRRNPTNGRLFARRGLALALNEDFAAALKDYNEALRLRPAEAVYYGDRGCIFLALGDFDRAIGDFNEEIRRIDSESESKRGLRLEWLKQRIADARSAKSQDSILTLEHVK
jgi:tetratricopeptide (TPR) repeat protein